MQGRWRESARELVFKRKILRPREFWKQTRKLFALSYRFSAETYSWKILRQGGPRYAADLVLAAAKVSKDKCNFE